MLLLLQTDVTARVEMEVRMTALNETQINLLDQVGMLEDVSIDLGAERCLAPLFWPSLISNGHHHRFNA
jgi:hypothetical protein